MNYPPQVAEILLEILRVGLLRIRFLGNAWDAQRCAIEADHLHNLPSLLANFSPDLLRYYWEVERTDYQNRFPPGEVTGFEMLWKRLEPMVTGIGLRA